MKKVAVHLLGNPFVEVDGVRINFPYKKAEGLLYYLCVRKNTTREEIIHVLWGDDNETAGRKSLREAIYRIKKMFGPDFLLTEGHTTICLNPKTMPFIDWDLITGETILETKDEGILAHFNVKNSNEYEEWVQSLQEEYNQMYLRSAQQKLYQADAKRDVNEIQQYSNILIKHDPYNEKLYYEAMDIYALNGNYNMAVKLYYNLEKILQEELEIEPSPEITALFQRIYHMKEDFMPTGAEKEVFFFGRTEELYRISECISGFSRGRSTQSLAISGNAGVGKSMLLERAKKMAVGYQLSPVSAVCYRNGTDFFLSPWCDIFQDLRQSYENGLFDADDVEEEFRSLTHTLTGSPLLKDEQERGYITYQILSQTIFELLRKLSKKHLLVVCFDDLQWMDSMSAHLLNRVLQALGTSRILLLCTFRWSDESAMTEALDALFQKDLIETIPLECFSQEETQAIARTVLPELESEPQKQAEIYQMTDGNAFFLMEMLNLIHEKGYSMEMSPKISNLIKSRLADLLEEENQILDCLSIFPEKVSIEELQLLLAMDEINLLRHLEKLVKQHLVKEIVVGWNIYYNSEHYFLSEYLYERQSAGKKKRCHQILAGYFETKYAKENQLHYVPMLIYHFERCHNLHKTYQYKIAYWSEFNEIAYENFPMIKREISSEQELPILTGGDMQLRNLAEAVLQWEDCSPEACRLKMEMDYAMGRYGISVGEYEQGLLHIHQSGVLAHEMGDRWELANCYKQIIFYGIQTENLEVIETYLQRGMNCISFGKQPYLYGVFLRLKGVYHLLCADYDQAEQLLQDSINVFEHRQNGQRRHSMNIAAGYGYMGDIRLEQGRPEEAYAYYCNAIKTNTEKVVTNGLGQFYAHAGQALDQMGRYAEARESLEKSLDCFCRYGYQWGLGRAEVSMALLELHCGHPQEARKHCDNAILVEEKIANPTTLRFIQTVKKELESLE